MAGLMPDLRVRPQRNRFGGSGVGYREGEAGLRRTGARGVAATTLAKSKTQKVGPRWVETRRGAPPDSVGIVHCLGGSGLPAYSACPRWAHSLCCSGVRSVGVSPAGTELQRMVSSN